MKRLLVLGFVLLLASCASYQKASAARAGEVIITYDDMTGIKKSEVFIDKTKFKVLEHNTELFIFRVAEHKETTNYYICFNLHYSNWWFVDTLLIKVGDADPIYLEAVSNDRDTYSILDYVGIQEWVVFEASLEMFQIAATAENIRVRVIGSKHREDYEITPEDQIIIKRLLAEI